MRVACLLLAVPLAVLLTLLAFPDLGWEWDAPGFHFYVVSAASLMSAAVCTVLVLSARSIRETRILFLALCFLSLAMIFAVHGLTTPGHLYQHFTAALERSPWLSTLSGGFFAALSVISVPKVMERARLRLSELVFGACAGLILLYFVVSLAFPDWLTGFPTRETWFRYLLSVGTIGLLLFAAWRYGQSYMFARLPGQLAVMGGLVLLAEAQVSLALGEVWYLAWWMYHGLFLAAFASVLGGWGWEMLRARDVKAIAEALVMRDALAQLNRGRPSTVVTLADQIENHDPATFRHVDRVAAYALAIGREMGFGPARLRELVLAAQMHDIGKIGLPSYILTKPGKLTDDEWTLIKRHPGKGGHIVARVPSLEGVARIIRHHHERYDGSGYPDGLAGEEIPLEARIIAAADTFDALTSERPYRAPMSVEA
ncbi:MAG TPA: HD domain-containing phosphohydrolase, partial [Dehalococcoidia bacterium]|nr:HD domain-containing phosphohydrolase [Dehalococcoidia bacterium]